MNNVTFDLAKDSVNLAKHGFSLRGSRDFEWENALVRLDKRRDYDEARMVGLVPVNGRLFCVVFVDRPPEQPTERRIINLRKANNREVNRYANNDQDTERARVDSANA